MEQAVGNGTKYQLLSPIGSRAQIILIRFGVLITQYRPMKGNTQVLMS